MTQRPESGYRGALPPRNDALARPWVLVVIGAFILMFVLAFLGFPSNVLTSPSSSAFPSISIAPSSSAVPSPSADAS